MQSPVKPRRRYHSPQRRLQAHATRQQIVEAAAQLFARDGYFGTTINAIAQQAKVAVPTVYAAFGNKRAILSALIDAAIFGPDPPGTPVAQRTWYRELATEADPARLLRRWGAYLCEVNARVAPLQRVIDSAAVSDLEIAELAQRIKHQRFVGQSAIAQMLTQRYTLQLDMGPDRMADIIFVLSDAHVYTSFVVDRGWSQSQMADWLGAALCRLLLPDQFVSREYTPSR